jgi:hypothetical protein
MITLYNHYSSYANKIDPNLCLLILYKFMTYEDMTPGSSFLFMGGWSSTIHVDRRTLVATFEVPLDRSTFVHLALRFVCDFAIEFPSSNSIAP